MRTARGKISVDIMLVTAPTTIGNKQLRQGDLLVSDGISTWGMSYEEATKRVTPSGKMAAAVFEEAERLVQSRPKFVQAEIKA